MKIDPDSDLGKLLADESFWRAANHKTIREKIDDLLIELEVLRAKLEKAEKVIEATVNLIDDYGYSLGKGVDDALLALKEYLGEETK